MKKLINLVLILLSITTFSIAGFAQAQSDNIDFIRNLDAKWERALQVSDLDFMSDLLSEEFVWIHNHASLIDSKKGLLARANSASGASGNPKSRTNKDVQVILVGSTAVVTGFTIVDRGPSPKTYHFMRTYAKTNKKWILLANQTMAIPQDTP